MVPQDASPLAEHGPVETGTLHGFHVSKEVSATSVAIHEETHPRGTPR
jgi:hypothetical protein